MSENKKLDLSAILKDTSTSTKEKTEEKNLETIDSSEETNGNNKIKLSSIIGEVKKEENNPKDPKQEIKKETIDENKSESKEEKKKISLNSIKENFVPKVEKKIAKIEEKKKKTEEEKKKKESEESSSEIFTNYKSDFGKLNYNFKEELEKKEEENEEKFGKKHSYWKFIIIFLIIVCIFGASLYYYMTKLNKTNTKKEENKEINVIEKIKETKDIKDIKVNVKTIKIDINGKKYNVQEKVNKSGKKYFYYEKTDFKDMESLENYIKKEEKRKKLEILKVKTKEKIIEKFDSN